MTAHIATMNLEVLATTLGQAQEIAQDANKHMFKGQAISHVISQLTSNTFLVTLGCNQHLAQQAHEEYLSEHEM